MCRNAYYIDYVSFTAICKFHAVACASLPLAAAAVKNSLPDNVKQSDSLPVFNNNLNADDAARIRLQH